MFECQTCVVQSWLLWLYVRVFYSSVSNSIVLCFFTNVTNTVLLLKLLFSRTVGIAFDFFTVLSQKNAKNVKNGFLLRRKTRRTTKEHCQFPCVSPSTKNTPSLTTDPDWGTSWTPYSPHTEHLRMSKMSFQNLLNGIMPRQASLRQELGSRQLGMDST